MSDRASMCGRWRMVKGYGSMLHRAGDARPPASNRSSGATTCMHMCIHMTTCMHMYMHMHMHVTCACHVHVHAHVCTCAHAHAHAHV